MENKCTENSHYRDLFCNATTNITLMIQMLVLRLPDSGYLCDKIN